jgi:hypothetical protein
VALLGLIGAGLCGYGVTLPWLTTFEGLLIQSGWGTRNGSIVLSGAVLAAVLAVAQIIRPTAVIRWLLALTGFVLVGATGYWLVQLYAVFTQLDGMTFAAKGSGLFVAAAGAGMIFATVFLPMPTGRVVSSPAVESQLADARTPLSRAARFVEDCGLRGLGSPWRYPAAGLALVVGVGPRSGHAGTSSRGSTYRSPLHGAHHRMRPVGRHAAHRGLVTRLGSAGDELSVGRARIHHQPDDRPSDDG